MLTLRSGVWIEKRQFDKALVDSNEAVRLDPRYARAFDKRGTIRFLKGDYEGAVANYDEAVRLDPNFAGAFINRGTSGLKERTTARHWPTTTRQSASIQDSPRRLLNAAPRRREERV